MKNIILVSFALLVASCSNPSSSSPTKSYLGIWHESDPPVWPQHYPYVLNITSDSTCVISQGSRLWYPDSMAIETIYNGELTFTMTWPDTDGHGSAFFLYLNPGGDSLVSVFPMGSSVVDDRAGSGGATIAAKGFIR